ncbi:MAG: 6-phosphogluconolactonase [Bacteroidota bacterium]|nr:6-phosphogluconolactonase [Bacteroidota bacterium]
MKLHIFDDKEILSEQLAEWICDLISDTLKHQQFFTIVLSGGGTPKMLYQKLASEKFKARIDWQRIHVFWGDERVVPFSDERNNAKMAFDFLLNHVDIPASQIHIMRTDIEPNFAVAEYRKKLHTFFDSTGHSFDLVLLGMGDDGHTLSLFPGSLLIDEHYRWVNSVYNEQQQMYRMTLMPLLVNKAGKVVFMVDGEKKAGVLEKVLEGEYKPAEFPAQLISPENGELHWFLDKAAAKNLHTI